MLIQLSTVMSLKVKYLTKRGEAYYFYLRVPKDLRARYGKDFIRQSLGKVDEKTATRKVESLAKRYLAEFESLRSPPDGSPVFVSLDAMEFAKALSEDEHGVLTDRLDAKRRAYAELSDDPEHTYRTASVSEYLSPVEAEAVQIVKEGIDKPRMSDAIAAYWLNHTRAGDAEHKKYVERVWDRLVLSTGNVPLESLTRATARGYVEHLRSTGLKTTSVRRNLNTINAVLNSAIREFGLLTLNPFSHLGIAGEGRDAKKAAIPTEDQLRDIIRDFEGKTSSTYLIALIMLETGPRVAEVSGLKVSDVFLDDPTPYFRIAPNDWRGVKTISSIRDVPLVGVSLEAMRQAVALPRDNDALFPQYARPGGNTAASAAVNKILRPYGITSHSFRHSLKDRLRDVGCPKDVRDVIQGHSKADIAEDYGHGWKLKRMQTWLLKAQTPTAAASE